MEQMKTCTTIKDCHLAAVRAHARLTSHHTGIDTRATLRGNVPVPTKLGSSRPTVRHQAVLNSGLLAECLKAQTRNTQ